MRGKTEAAKTIKKQKKKRSFGLNQTQQLILIGIASFLAAFGLVFFLGDLLLMP